MKRVLLAMIVLSAYTANAISFITEKEVAAVLGAEKVIEISKYSVAEKLKNDNSDCYQSTFSRSARAYVVRQNSKTLLFVTTSSLADLQECGSI